jgi:predicted RNase H-like nuclease (RuvC/YqgF family)
MAVCWQYTDGHTERLSDDEVIERFWCLKDEIKELKEQNAKLTTEVEQLKAANGEAKKKSTKLQKQNANLASANSKAVDALRLSKGAIQKLQEELKEEDQPVDHTAMCRACSSQCAEAKALLEQIDRYEGRGESPVLDGYKMQMARMSGSCESKRKFQLKNTLSDRYGDARGFCP